MRGKLSKGVRRLSLMQFGSAESASFKAGPLERVEAILVAWVGGVGW